MKDVFIKQLPELIISAFMSENDVVVFFRKDNPFSAARRGNSKCDSSFTWVKIPLTKFFTIHEIKIRQRH